MTWRRKPNRSAWPSSATPSSLEAEDGSLDMEKFKFYVRQDYVYLIDFSCVLALASARAPDQETMGWFARLLHETLNTEMDLHRSYCAQFGIAAWELEETRAAPTTFAYTRFLLSMAYYGSYPELVASFLPCQWGYWEVGDDLARKGEPTGEPLYCQWIRMYASSEYKSLADSACSLAKQAGRGRGATRARSHAGGILDQLAVRVHVLGHGLQNGNVASMKMRR